MRANNPAQSIDWMTIFGIFYLFIPNIIFLTGWVNPAAASVVIAAISFLLYRKIQNKNIQWKCCQPGTLLALVALSIIWASSGGAGHIGYANTDWHVRDSVYGDLINNQWPIYYEDHDSSIVILRSAIGYFLPPALLSSLAGLKYADALLLSWTVLGTFSFLSICFGEERKQTRLFIGTISVILFSGLDSIGYLIKHGYWPDYPFHIEWWARDFQYSSMSTQLAWVPNHALPAWIATAILFRHRDKEYVADLTIVCMILTMIWSPFATLGLIPFALITAFRKDGLCVIQHTVLKNKNWVLYLIIASPLVAYLTIGYGTLPVTSTLTSKEHQSLTELALNYAEFICLEFGFLCLILYKYSPEHRTTVMACAVTLLALPFMKLGPSNDIVMRASIPALVTLSLICANFLNHHKNTYLTLPGRIAIIITLIFGSITAIYEIGRAWSYRPWPANYQKTLKEEMRGFMSHHYAGKIDDPLRRWLFSPPAELH